MTTRRTCGALAAMLIASSALATAAYADAMTMWVRASGANAAAHLVDLWNSTHPDKIELTTIPDNQMVTKLATGVQAGDVPDLVSFDLIYMPDFMKAGFLVDLTADLKANPNYASVAQAYKDIATYEGKLYGAGFTPDVSILVWNKDLFKKAGLDPDKPPQTVDEFRAAAKALTRDSSGSGHIDQWGVDLTAGAEGGPWRQYVSAAKAFGGRLVASPYATSKPDEPVTWNSPATVAAFKWLVGLYSDGYSPPSTPSDSVRVLSDM